jgi:hypothetical protein
MGLMGLFNPEDIYSIYVGDVASNKQFFFDAFNMMM